METVQKRSGYTHFVRIWIVGQNGSKLPGARTQRVFFRLDFNNFLCDFATLREITSGIDSDPEFDFYMQPRYEDFIRDVLITVHMNLRELRERRNFADPPELVHIEAKLLAYQEMLSILRDSAEEFDLPVEELGL